MDKGEVRPRDRPHRLARHRRGDGREGLRRRDGGRGDGEGGEPVAVGSWRSRDETGSDQDSLRYLPRPKDHFGSWQGAAISSLAVPGFAVYPIDSASPSDETAYRLD